MRQLGISNSTIGARRFAVLAASSVVCLTLLFTAQDAMRRGLGGGGVNWPHVFAINALDWVVWGVLLPFIVAIGGRIRLDGGGSRVRRVAGWIVLAISFCAVQSAITGMVIRFTDPRLFGMAPPPGAAPRPLGVFLLGWGVATSSLNLLIFGMTAGVFHAALYYRDLRARQLRDAELHARLASAELNVLRLQLQPHFLFNALHTVSSLMVTDVPTAQRVVSALGDLLRLSLDHTARQEIPLREELVFVQRYVEIQRARFRHRLTVTIDVPGSLEDALVPSLVLQPLVENAIRHAIEPSAEGGHVWVRAERVEASVLLTVENDAPPNGKRPDVDRRRPGVGLTNLSARLRQLYGDAHSFRARAGPDGTGRFVVSLTLPYHTDGAPSPTAFPQMAGVR